MNYVVTALDQRYWNPWGISWIASLRELAQTNSKLIVLNTGLTHETLQKLHSLKVRVVQGHVGINIRNHAVSWAAKLSVEEAANCAYFDADCWFQRGIDDLWGMLENKLVLVQGKNPGFVAGTPRAWSQFASTKNIFDFMKDGDYLDSFIRFFGQQYAEIPEAWNCTRLQELQDKEGWLCIDGEPMNVIHPYAGLKTSAAKRNLMFQERYPDLFEQYIEKPARSLSLTSRRLILPKK